MWLNAEERSPRVRFGQIDLYDNYYSINHPLGYGAYVYSWGAGVSSHIYAQNNAFTDPGNIYSPSHIVYDYGNLTQPAVCVLDARWNNPDATVDPVGFGQRRDRIVAIDQHRKFYWNLCRLDARGGNNRGNHPNRAELQLLDSNATDGRPGSDPGCAGAGALRRGCVAECWNGPRVWHSDRGRQQFRDSRP